MANSEPFGIYFKINSVGYLGKSIHREQWEGDVASKLPQAVSMAGIWLGNSHSALVKTSPCKNRAVSENHRLLTLF